MTFGSHPPITVILPDFPLDAASLTDISNMELDPAQQDKKIFHDFK